MFRPNPVRIALLVCLAAFAFSLMSPLSSNRYLTSSRDMVLHMQLTDRLAQAVEDRQWPPRLDISEIDHRGYGYPAFQFEGPLFHAAAAALTAPPFDLDAHRAVRLLLWALLIAGGGFMFLLCRRLTGHEAASVLGALAFVTLPYGLITLHALGALPELAAQMLIPACVWLTLRLADRPGYPRFAAAVMGWLGLLLTHTVTALTTPLALGVFLAVYGALARRPVRPLAFALLPLAVAMAAAFWILGPLLFYPTALKAALGPLDYEAQTGFMSFWRLFAPLSLPDPAHPDVKGLNPALGLPALFFAAGALTVLVDRRVWRERREAAAATAAAVLVFAGAGLMVELPPPFLDRLPSAVLMIRHTYRLLAQAGWAAGPMAAGAALLLFRGRVELPHAVIGGFLCLAGAGSYLFADYDPGIPPSYTLAHDLAHREFLPVGDKVAEDSGRTLSFQPVACRSAAARWTCPVAPELAGRPGVLPVLFYPGLTTLSAGGRAVPMVGVPVGDHVLIGVESLPAGETLTVRFTGAPRADAVSLAALAGLAGTGLVLAARALRRRRNGEAPAPASALAPALAALPPLALLLSAGAGALLPPPPDSPPRRVALTDWTYTLEARLTPGPVLPRPDIHWPVFSGNWTGRDRLLILADPVPGAPPGTFAFTVDHLGVSKDTTAPVRAGLFRFTIASDATGARLTLGMDGATLLERRSGPLPVTMVADGVPGLNAFPGYPLMADAFPGEMTVTALRLEQTPVVARFLKPRPFRSWLFGRTP